MTDMIDTTKLTNNQMRELLISARFLISDKEHWTQGAYARDKTGKAVWSGDEQAYSFCFWGAVIRASKNSVWTALNDTLINHLKKTAKSLFSSSLDNQFISMGYINDNKDDPQAYEKVMLILNTAISNLDEKEAPSL